MDEELEVKYSNLYMSLIDLSTKIENGKRSLNGALPLGSQGPRVMDLQQYKEAIVDLLDVCEKGLRELNQEIRLKTEYKEYENLHHQYKCLAEALSVSLTEVSNLM